jgi:hypothetical protein
MRFADLQKTAKARKPPTTATLSPSAFSDDRTDKPTAPITVGVRLLSEQETQQAKGQAARVAWEFHESHQDEEEQVRAYNDALMRIAVSYGITAPERSDIAFFAMAELEVRQRLTPEGIRFLFHQIEQLHIAESPVITLAGQEEISHLVALLERGKGWDRLEAEERRRCGRLLEYVRMQLEDAEAEAEAAGEQIFNS